jgi:hypothetical protein
MSHISSRKFSDRSPVFHNYCLFFVEFTAFRRIRASRDKIDFVTGFHGYIKLLDVLRFTEWVTFWVNRFCK